MTIEIAGSQGSIQSIRSAQVAPQNAFQRSDADSSGGLNVNEFVAFQRSKALPTGRSLSIANVSEAFRSIDTNRNGEISQAEVRAYHLEKSTPRELPTPSGRVNQEGFSVLLQAQEDGFLVS